MRTRSGRRTGNFSLADIEERKFWKNHMRAFEQCLGATGPHSAPWYIVPADDKENARLIVSQILFDTMKALGSVYPKVDAKRRRELRATRARLAK
jgi:polyphosphate kinase 2 (PPK2 family)